jgi:DNA polymerase-1
MNHVLIQNNNFPTLPDVIDELYLDFETTSFDPKKSSVDVWKSCWIAGVAFTWDDHDTEYFIPIRYRDHYSEEKNCSEFEAFLFIQSLYNISKVWINHNIKYDYHVASREKFKLDHLILKDTLTRAKLVQSDRFVYSEDVLSADWLGIENVDEHKMAMLPFVEDSKDWGEIPIRFMAPYACHDVYKNRLLFHYIEEHLPEDVKPVATLEEKVTKCLCRCEQVGLSVNPLRLKIEETKVTAEMLTIAEKIRRQHGLLMRPNVNADCYEVFHKQMGFPVVGFTEKDNKPSYDKYALATLRQYPGAPIELIDDCLRYRENVSHNGFIKSYRKHELNGRLHASYNQVIRTGRMSCKEPNMQQLNKRAKEFIEPHENYVFLSFDFSAIEFRLLAHYLGQPEILAAYAEDPDTDFHQWVADMCHVDRKPAKNINFCMAYGGGKKKVLSMLANNADIIKELEADSPEEFEARCFSRAESIFKKYHNVLYKLRPLTSMAANRLKSRGFVKNGYGRHRHLPIKACYRALNTVIQSTAADAMKEAVYRTSPIYNEALRDFGVEQVAYVHDEILFICPRRHIEDWYFQETSSYIKEKDRFYYAEGPKNEVIQEIVKGMLVPSERFSVPLRVSAAICEKNWADAIELPKELIY